MINIVKERPKFSWRADGVSFIEWQDVIGVDESMDFVHERLGPIERIKMIRLLNKGIGLKDAKDIMEAHREMVPVRDYPR